jgi:hypothetical protein
MRACAATTALLKRLRALASDRAARERMPRPAIGRSVARYGEEDRDVQAGIGA